MTLYDEAMMSSLASNPNFRKGVSDFAHGLYVDKRGTNYYDRGYNRIKRLYFTFMRVHLRLPNDYDTGFYTDCYPLASDSQISTINDMAKKVKMPIQFSMPISRWQASQLIDYYYNLRLFE